MIDAPRATAAFLSLILAAGLAGCSTEADQGEPGTDAGQAPSETSVSGDFAQQNMLITAVCSPGNRTAVFVDGWDPQSRKHMAHAEFPLPATAVVESDKHSPITAVRELCEPDHQPADMGDATAIRSIFDRDFTKMAVVTKDPETEATHVGYVDRAGKFTDLTGNQDFGNTPHEHNAAFARDGSAIWFTYRAPDSDFEQTKDRVASRPLTGDHKAVDHLEYKGVISEDMITLEGGRAVLAGQAFLSPDGKRLLAGGRVLDAPPEGQAVGPDFADGASIPCGDGWIDDDTVLCDTQDDRFATVDTTPGAEPGAPIVPENDHRNEPMVISPDGQRFVFLSAKGAARDHFISGTAPGSTPEKVERTGPFATLGDTAVFIEWR